MAPQTSEAYLVLLDIHTDAGIIYLTSDSVPTTLGGSGGVDKWALEAPASYWKTEANFNWITEEQSGGGGGGIVYNPFPFNITLPADREGQISTAQLRVDNVSQALIDDIRQMATPIRVDITVVLSSDLSIMAQYTHFTWRGLTYDILSISGQLTLEGFLNEPFPQDKLTGRTYPGLF
jgi:hypothetical protein